jgi:hypothetical protein
LSRLITGVLSEFNQCRMKFEPINPAPPVTTTARFIWISNCKEKGEELGSSPFDILPEL